MLKVLSIILLVFILIVLFIFCIFANIVNSRTTQDIEEYLLNKNDELKKDAIILTKEIEKLKEEIKELRK